MAKFGNKKTQYRFIHSLTDKIAPFNEKNKYSLLLKELEFDVMFKEIWTCAVKKLQEIKQPF